MINLWRRMEVLPPDIGEFLASERMCAKRHVILRRAQIYNVEYEQFVNKDWHPAFVRPRFWKRIEPQG